VNYSKTGSFSCSKCPPEAANIAKLTGTLIIFLVFLILLVRSTISGAKGKKNFVSVYVKVLLNHMQLVVLTASFKLSWPEVVESLFGTFSPAMQASDQVLSIDCFIDPRTNSVISMRIFFMKLLIFCLLPILVLLVTTIVWSVIRCIKRESKEWLARRAKATIVILLFFTHPNISEYVFNAFKCENIDGEQRLYSDLQVLCYENRHMFAILVAAPSFFVWGILLFNSF